MLSAAAGATVATSGMAAAAQTKKAIFELRYFRMRNGTQVQRTQEFLGKQFLPAAKRAGIGPMGFFTNVIGEESPTITCLLSFPSFEAMGTSLEKMEADKEFAAAFEEYNSAPELNYIRMESSLLRGFDTMPAVEVPPAREGRGGRVFELRIYESPNIKTLKRKMNMFDIGEIAIFRRNGLLPVFFGEALVGSRMPNLTYMVAFDDMAARDKAWGAFGGDPEWKKLRAQPGLSDAEIVSNISNSILRGLPFSPIR
jgi:hypothetical protein